MASPRERDHRPRSRPSDVRHVPQRVVLNPHYDPPPEAHQRHQDYVYVDRWGWWPRWFPYWDSRWVAYWQYLFNYYGGAAYPEFAEYARDAVLRQTGAQWGLVVSGAWVGAVAQDGMVVRDHRADGLTVRDHRGDGLTVRDHRGDGLTVRDHRGDGLTVRDHRGDGLTVRDHRGDGRVVRDPRDRAPVHVSPGHPQYPEQGRPAGRPDRPHYEHPHHYHHDYVTVDRYWWPRWFPYWDQRWVSYWWQLYYYYGGSTFPAYALYAVDATLRGQARQLGWF